MSLGQRETRRQEGGSLGFGRKSESTHHSLARLRSPDATHAPGLPGLQPEPSIRTRASRFCVSPLEVPDMNTNLGAGVQAIMDYLSDGVYVCDTERRIVCWSQSAERVTGWTSEDVVGRRSFGNLLCYVDKDVH